jgi:hypothetical protein
VGDDPLREHDDEAVGSRARRRTLTARNRPYSPAMALFEPIFDALNRRNVRYVVVGGVAVVLHGHARLTADLDIAVDLGPEAARDAVAALTDIGLRPRLPVDANDFGDAASRERWQREKGMTVFSMWDPADPLRSVDLFVENPIDFEELWSGAEAIDLDGTPTRIASIPDLIRLKRIAGRPQDLADIEALERLARRDG